MTSPNADLHPDVPWLDGEQFDMSIDASAGIVGELPRQGDALAITNRRIVQITTASGEQTIASAPFDRIDSVETVEAFRPSERLTQGSFLAGVGVALAFITWSLIGVPFVSILAGGVPALFAVYAFAAWLFPDTEGTLRLYVRGRALSQPLRSAKARRDARLVMQRISELLTAEYRPAVPAQQPSQSIRPESAVRRPHVPVRQRPWSPFRERRRLPRPRPAARPAPPSVRRKRTALRKSAKR